MKERAHRLGERATQFFVATQGESDAELILKSGPLRSLLLMLLAETGSLVIKNSNLVVLEATQDKELVVAGKGLRTQDLEYSGNLVSQELEQWVRIVSETFSGERRSIKGWRPSVIT